MSTALLLTVVAVFGTVALAVGALAAFVLSETGPERRRLHRVGQVQQTGVVLEGAALAPEANELAQKITSFVPRSPDSVSKLRKRFMRAGYQTLTPMAAYTIAQIVLPIALAWPGLILLSSPRSLIVAGLGAAIGWLAPGFYVDWLVAKRQRAIQNGLPDALDLMIVCLEAGSALDQAILKVSDELGLAYPALAEEFRMIITETRAGKPRLDAFRNFAARTGVDDVRSLVAMLVQTDKFGTSVSQALRIHAETARTKRRQRAEERAAKIGVKMVFPLVFALFPAFFVVSLGPAVIRFIRVLFGQILGQQ